MARKKKTTKNNTDKVEDFTLEEFQQALDEVA